MYYKICIKNNIGVYKIFTDLDEALNVIEKTILLYKDQGIKGERFEETIKRHQTKPNCNDFGEEAMRRWWREKDFSDVLNEVSITSERDIESIVSDICNTVINN